MTCYRNLFLTTCAIAAAAGWTAPAFAQQAAAPAEARPAPPENGEILVTARKRQESILEVPVVLTAIGEAQLGRLQTTEIADLPKLVPGLQLGNSLLSIGTLATIRGIGTSSNDPGIDQSVSLNIDGLALGNGLAFWSGLFDLQQIEVLKGPQALFFGKSSPGGVISLRTADPTDKVEVIGRAAYEFEGDEGRGELVLSGPLGDTLKARVAGQFATGRGYFRNEAIAGTGLGARNPDHRRETRPRNYVVRGTVLWQPASAFTARLKVNVAHDRATNAEAFQLSSCPDGLNRTVAPNNIPFIVGDNCKLDRNVRVTYLDPAAFPGVPNNGTPFLKNDQRFGTLELNYDLSPQLALTSVTAYYDLSSRSMVSASHGAVASTTLGIDNRFKRRDFTEELRLNSDFDGALNFTLGGFYQDASIFDRVNIRGNRALPAPIPFINAQGSTAVDIKTYSLFGQLRWKILPRLELAGGARWTDETRSEDVFNYLTNLPVTVANPRIKANNIAPEATLTYTPTDDLTIFGAYKRGFKSGSFTIATVPLPGADNAFGDEKVEGGEVGLKARLLDRSLLLNVAAYDYRYTGLQVGTTQPAVGGLPIIRTVNAGSARAYGVDFDASYRPRNVPGLGLNGAVNFNRGRYKTLNNVPCYGGQTVAEGCNQFRNPATGRFTAQDLSGTPLIRAPRWQATFGFDYEMAVGGNLRLTFANSNQYSSRFATLLAFGDPAQGKYQGRFVKSDLSLALGGADDRWEVALVGKNVTDRITAGNCSISDYAGGSTNLNGQITGSTGPGPAGRSEKGCFTDRGRSVWLRLTLRPLANR